MDQKNPVSESTEVYYGNKASSSCLASVCRKYSTSWYPTVLLSVPSTPLMWMLHGHREH